MDEDGGRFAAWFTSWKQARPDVISPIGWYVLADLEAAFNAGRADQHQQVLDEILERTRALEELLRATPRKVELGQLSLDLVAVEAWLREQPARHSHDMADVVDRAWRIIDDLYDEAEAEGPD